MLKVAKYLHTKFWLLVAWLIISTAILLTLMRLLLPLLDLTPFEHEIERIAEQQAGLPLRIGSMHARVQDAHLALQFNDVSLLDPHTGKRLLYFREAHADIHLLRSLWEGRLILGRGMVVGGRLDLLRRHDGSILVNGIPETAAGAGQGGITGAFLRHSQLRVRDSEVLWREETGGRRPLHLTQVNANLFNTDGRHRLMATANVRNGRAQERLKIVADLHEAVDKPLSLSGPIYLKGDNIGMAGRLQGLLPAGSRLVRGRMDLEFWGQLKAGMLTQLEGSLALRNVALSGISADPLRLERFSSNLGWRQDDSGWLLGLDRLILMHDRQLWPPGRLVISQQRGEAGVTDLLLAVDYLGLRETTRLAALLLPAEGALRQALVGMDPNGHLTRFRLARRQADGEESRWWVSGAVSQLSSRAWKAVPGLDGLGMHFEGNQDGGSLLLGSRRVSMKMPRLFREPLDANRLDGHFRWRLDPLQGLWLETSNLHMCTEHLQTLSRLRLQVPLQDGQTFIDMQTDFWDGDGAQKGRYLPVGIMPKPLVDWLDRSLVSGHVKAGSMLLYGPLKSFPYNDLEGRFEVLFGIEDMVLDYREGWPRLEEGVAEAHFLNNSLRIELLEGKMLDSELQSAVATIRRLKGASPVEVQGDFTGSLGDLLRFLDESPLRAQFGRFTQMVAGAGGSHTWIDIKIPLQQTDRFEIDGRVDLHNASLAIKDFNLVADRLNGQLRFDEKNIAAVALKARLFGQSLRVDINPVVIDDGAGTRISTTLLASQPLLQRFMPASMAAYFEGETPADAHLDILHEAVEVPVRLKLDSALRGVTLAFPQPLGKGADETRRLELELGFRRDQKTDLRLAYDGRMHALLRDEGAGFRRGEVLFGAGQPMLPGSPLVMVDGELARLDADSWLAWLSRQPEQDTGQPLAVRLDLRLGELLLAGIESTDVKFQLGRVQEGWRANILSSQLDGSLTLPANIAINPLDVHLRTLKLKSEKLLPEEDEDQVPSRRLDLDPADIPALSMRVERLFIDDKPFGTAQVQWQRVPGGINLTQLSLTGERLTLNGDGAWHLAGDMHTTALHLQGEVASLGQLQEDLQLQLGIDKAPMHFEADLTWPSNPTDFDLTRLSGELALKVGTGEVTQVDPGVGRLVGLLSLHALGKRLLLDFSDLFAKGLEFDRIEGTFDLSNGDAYTADLEMVGPSVKIDVSGRIGLKARDYDQLVTVIPRLSSTLPVVGALALNPTVGVALAVAQQLFGKQVDRITQTQYALTGTWEEPVIEKIAREAEAENQDPLSELP